MGEITYKKNTFFSSDILTITLECKGNKKQYEHFLEAVEQFKDYKLSIDTVLVFHNMSILESQIWWQWGEDIEDTTGLENQKLLFRARKQYLEQSRATLLALENEIYGYDVIWYTVYSERLDRHYTQQIVLMDTEAPLKNKLELKLCGEAKIPISERDLKNITEQLNERIIIYKGEYGE